MTGKRVLFTCLVGYGNLHPMLPLARALAGRGDAVAFATGEGFCPWIERTGFAAFPAGLHRDAYIDELKKRYPEYPKAVPRPELLRFRLTKECTEFLAPAMARDLVDVVDRWAPDLLVHDMEDFAGPIVARLAAIPRANHSSTILFPREDWELAALAIAPLWTQWGLELEPLGGMFTQAYIDICPPSLQTPSMRDLPVTHLLRPMPVHVPLDDSAPPDGLAPSWLTELPDRPTVYVDFGTIFNKQIQLFATAIAALAEEAVSVVVAVGHDVDPSQLGPLPDNAYVERYLPRAEILPRCDAVVSHGGAGGMFAALSHGLPMVFLPQGVDQFNNARQCEYRGVGIGIPTADQRPEVVRDRVLVVLSDPSYRVNAIAVREEIRGMPDPDRVVEALDQLTFPG